MIRARLESNKATGAETVAAHSFLMDQIIRMLFDYANAQVFALFDAIGRPELKTDPRFSSVPARFQNTKEYFAIRAKHMVEKTTAEWIEIFDRCDIPAKIGRAHV